VLTTCAHFARVAAELWLALVAGRVHDVMLRDAQRDPASGIDRTSVV
jgi:hypothetical protein